MNELENAVPLAHEESEPTVCGYRNHATFTVAMRLSNTSATYAAQVRVLVLDAIGSSRSEYARGRIAFDKVGFQIRMTLASMLKERIEAECAPVPRGALSELGHDLLSYALACVDWTELADEWLADARERGVSV